MKVDFFSLFLIVMAFVASILVSFDVITVTLDSNKASGLVVLLSILGVVKLSDLLEALIDFIVDKVRKRNAK